MQIGSSTPSPYAGMTDMPPRRDTDADAMKQPTAPDTVTARAVEPAPVATEAAASSVRQFASGALGLDSPGTSSDDTNAFYTAGKWVAAAVTVGKIVSLFI
ncbi:hypothetical protein [Caballeronia grimmiae]|uniref:hypothetical protein n=2 Tax=Caballeronia TaxID=1827195 RepID=UPI001FD51733|nr:hypothetical protein [Caballeronia grimmiae]